LAFIGNRPQLVHVVAEEFGARQRLSCRHPIVVAAQRVDFAVMRNHSVRMRQRPGWKRVGREALVNKRERALEILVVQIGVIGAELIGQEHAFVNQGAARNRYRIIAGVAPFATIVENPRDRLAQNVESTFEFVP
jgi:hypothetical protein